MAEYDIGGDKEIYVDALEDLRRALPDEQDDEFHDARDEDCSTLGLPEIVCDEVDSANCSPTDERRNNAKSVEEGEKSLISERKLRESYLNESELEDRYKTGQMLKAEGNDLFRNGKFDDAVSKYTEALNICPLIHQKERSIMYSNRAACHIRKDELEVALENCNYALQLHPLYLKCLVRRAEIQEKLEKLDEALEDYQNILKLDSNNGAARVKCMILPERIRERNEKLKAEMFGKLKDLGDMFLKPFGLSTNNFQCVQDPNTGGYSINFKQ